MASRRRRANPNELTSLEGIGPVTARRLADAGLRDVTSLALLVPRRYHETLHARVPDETLIGRRVALLGRCVRSRALRLRGRRSMATLRVAVPPDAPGGEAMAVEAAFFGRHWIAGQVRAGRVVRVAGTLERSDRGAWSLRAPAIELEPGDARTGARLHPVYPKVPGIAASQVRKLVARAVARVVPHLEEEHGAAFLTEHEMLPLPSAISLLHEPGGDLELLERARRRVALLEAVELMAAVRARRESRNRLAGWPVEVTPEIDARIRERLPFAPSAEQEACISVLCADLARPRPMARLLQGDVGMGKTMVAVYAALAVAAAGLTSVLLVPTEVLAEQHARRVGRWLAGARLPVVLLTSSVPAGARRDAIARLAGPVPCLAIGTHALLSDTVRIERLGLLVIDEQHRFGVEQRGKLFHSAGDRAPHVLVMSATPIPRTMATALYGDLDVSEIRERPVARPPVATTVRSDRDWPDVRAEIEAEVAAGGRVFVVCPWIGENGEAEDGGPDAAARATFRELRARVPAALAHGRQKPGERRAAEAAFRAGDVGCLVATTVVEVGIDVPEATLMVVRGADRLGISTLHQLRGRVGRGDRPARCILLGEATLARLAILERSHDGFEIAEADLRERGAGELTGRLQHGHHRFRCLRPVDDRDLLRLASVAT